jgi:hypothetical protein
MSAQANSFPAAMAVTLLSFDTIEGTNTPLELKVPLNGIAREQRARERIADDNRAYAVQSDDFYRCQGCVPCATSTTTRPASS